MAAFTKKQMLKDGIVRMYGLETDVVDDECGDDNIRGKKDFVKAMLVMKKVQEDGVPGVIPLDNDCDNFLCIGSVGSAYNLQGLKELGVTHVLCMADICKAKFPENFVYKKVSCRDTLGKFLLDICFPSSLCW